MTISPEMGVVGLLFGVFLFNLAVNRWLEWVDERMKAARRADRKRRRQQQAHNP